MTWRVVGANFDQMHMNTNVLWARDHPDAEVVGLCDEQPDTSTGSLERAAEDCDVPDEYRYDDLDRCIRETEPDLVLGGPMNAEHASFVEQVADHGVHVAIEKPMAMSLSDADRMVAAADEADVRLAINWPVAWYPVHNEVKRLAAEGVIGEILEIQYYGGNAGAPPADSWFYRAECGGGSMLDYLGYGATFATWFRDGDLPQRVSAQTDVPDDMEVDVRSTTVCRYETGLSTFQTSLRMSTHPWEHDSTPAKGYDIVGTEGAITTRQHDAPIRVQTDDSPDGYAVDPGALEPPRENIVQYLIYRLERDEPLEGPTNPTFCRNAHRIIETASRSADDEGRELPLVD